MKGYDFDILWDETYWRIIRQNTSSSGINYSMKRVQKK